MLGMNHLYLTLNPPPRIINMTRFFLIYREQIINRPRHLLNKHGSLNI